MPLTTFTIQTVCHGNICRSPMAAVVLRHHLDDAVPHFPVQVSSSGVSAEEQGHPIDRRAGHVLERHGYAVDYHHRAHRITSAELRQTDLILPSTSQQAGELVRRGAQADRVRLLRSFDPALAGLRPGPELDLDDPWWGTEADFESVLDQLERLAPGVVDYVSRLS
ncbi:MAG: low molecular weight phosphotyrosine protein phosphatase [Bifidobacteriaceae bacterium]|jgi:protein-tyrosine phosphatase|nr:low molecular weight phosphotyrosine protein phosphatase [Bifidobacteriaceae bacterium]